MKDLLDRCLDDIKKVTDSLDKALIKEYEESQVKCSEHEVVVSLKNDKGEINKYIIPFESAAEAKKYFNNEVDAEDWESVDLVENGEVISSKWV